VGSLGEFGLIRALASRMPAGPFTSLGIGDDSAVVAAPSGSVVAAVDLVLEGRHFLRSWSSGYDVGVKSAARSLADIAAMGAVPTALLVAVALPGTLPASWALDLASGLAAEADRAGSGIIGGDTASADSVLVSVTALGDLAGAAPVVRSGARAGDVVAVAGSLGRSAAGLALLSEGTSEGAANGVPEGIRAGLGTLVTAHLRPSPPYDAGPEAARLGAHAMIDVSDGLLADLGHIATASGVTIDLSERALEPFLGSPLAEAAATIAAARASSGAAVPGPALPGPALPGLAGPGPAARGRAVASSVAPPSVRSTVLDWVLTGGEDHSLVATFPASAELPPRWQVIGKVRAAAAVDSAGKVTVDGRPWAGAGGWEHFR